MLDITTGEFRVTECGEPEGVRSELASLDPREILLPEGEAGEALRQAAGRESWPGDGQHAAGRGLRPRAGRAPAAAIFSPAPPWNPSAAPDCRRRLAPPGRFSITWRKPRRAPSIISAPCSTYHARDFMVLDDSTRRNLELTATLHDGSRRGSLLGVLDRTVTAMGGRRLRQWIHQPLVDVARIRQRHQAVEELVEKSLLRADLRAALDGVYDLERLNGKISMASANAKDLVALRRSLERLPLFLEALSPLEAPLLAELRHAIDPLARCRRADRPRPSSTIRPLCCAKAA